MKKALLIVDVQNDFLPGGALPVPDGDAVIPVANLAMPLFEIVLATQDWHPANHGSFASRHPGHKTGDEVFLDGLQLTLWPDHCVQNTHGADFATELNRRPILQVFRKGTEKDSDSYSGFYDNAHRKSTGLAEYLWASDVMEITIVGLTTDYCVNFTSTDARALGLKTTVILEGVRGVELKPGDCAKALDRMRSTGVLLQSISELE
ncbi:MAG: bifunctional nicotinamidase/pyrazinamidase [Victivallales bacterium]|jgi:nicotinamidase/pyrazinamidase